MYPHDISYTIGALLGDGYVSLRGNNTVQIGTQDREIPLMCHFQTWFITNHVIDVLRNPSGKLQFYVKYFDYKWHQYLLSIFGNYKTDMMSYAQTLTRPQLLDLLAGLLDTDGSYGPHARLYIQLTGNYTKYPFIEQFPSLTDIIGLEITKPHKAAKMVTYNIHIDSFIDNHCYFRVLRKMNNVREYSIKNNKELYNLPTSVYDEKFKDAMKNTMKYIPNLKAFK